MCSTWILRYVIRRNSRAANNSVARAKSSAPHEIFRRFGLAEGDTFPPLPSACLTSQRYRSIGHVSRRATTLGTAEIARWHGAFLLSGRAACVLFDSPLIGSGTAALLWVRSVSCRSTYGQLKPICSARHLTTTLGRKRPLVSNLFQPPFLHHAANCEIALNFVIRDNRQGNPRKREPVPAHSRRLRRPRGSSRRRRDYIPPARGPVGPTRSPRPR